MTTPMTSDSEDYGEWQIHAKSVCSGFCPFHNPSDHPLKDAPIHIRGDKMMLVERICEHGVGHDDPDSVAYFHSKGEMWAGIHGCDGCCGTKVSEDGSSTDDHANTEPLRELAQEAQSEAPSVDEILDELVNEAVEVALSQNFKIGDELKTYKEAKAKINRLISGAYNKGYSDGRLVKPKYKVGDIAGNYQITERFRRVGKNTKFKVVCILCGAPMFRYSNKFNLKHKECGAIKND